MFGAFIGDIVGSKYEFNNIKTKSFPLFSKDCDYTDDTIMTAAVAKAIILSRQQQYKTNGKGKGFQEFLVEVMQDFGKRYPDPMGAYGGKLCQMAPAERSQALWQLWQRFCHACLSLRAGRSHNGRSTGVGSCQRKYNA